MEAIPEVLANVQDWFNAAEWAARHGEAEKAMLLQRLEGLVKSNTVKKLKPGATPTVDPITGESDYLPSDWEDVEDDSAPFQRSGLTADDVAALRLILS